jgi:spermidine synthase
MRLTVSAIAAGLAAMTAQLLLARELMVVSLGDELSVGLVFFAWLLWVGAGSAAGGAFVRRREVSQGAAGGLLILLGALLPASVLWARAQGPLFGYVHGELVPVDVVLLMSLASLAPVCLTAGFIFPVLCASAESARAPGAPGRVYAWDTLGAVAGGLAFSLLFVNVAGPVTIAFAACIVAAGAGAVWLEPRGRNAVLLLIAFAAASSPAWIPRAESAGHRLAWGRSPVESVESGYGNITVLRDAGQYSFFASGRLAGTVPDPVFGEYMAHVPLLAHPAPKRVFFMGASPDTIREALKHGLDRVVWAELDPKLIALKKKHTPSGLKSVYTDPRVKIAARDPRRYLAKTAEKYDVIVINAGAPETVSLNRYFTEEAFGIARARLNPGGVIALTIPFRENYMGPAEKALLGSIILSAEGAGLKDFRFVIGPRPLLLIGVKGAGPGTAAARYAARGIKSAHFDAGLASYYFDPRRTESSLMQFSRNPMEYLAEPDKTAAALNWLAHRSGAVLNADDRPAAIFLHAEFASSYYRNSIVGRLLVAGYNRTRNPFSGWRRAFFIILLAVSVLAAAWAGRSGAGRTAAAFFSLALAGAIGMFMEISLVVAFQNYFGVVYRYLGVIAAMFLLGSSAGAWAALRAEEKRPAPVSPVMPVLFLCLVCVAQGVFFAYGNTMRGDFAALFIPALALIAGAPVGAVFPLAVRFVKGAESGKTASAAGALYFADLLGASAGALVSTVILIPLDGMPALMVFALLLGICAAVALIRRREKK